MTITIKKLHLAIAVLVVALIAPATALAGHVFSDVSDGRFYSDPVEWAAANGVANGRGGGIFDPDGSVTRGESVTFLKRYEDNVVQPAITGVEARLAALEAAQPFAVTSFNNSSGSITTTPVAYVSVTVTAPSAGHVTLNSTAKLFHSGTVGKGVSCIIAKSTNIPNSINNNLESTQWMEIDTIDEMSVSGARTFSITAGATVTYVLACEEFGADGGYIDGANLTAIFTPAP